MELLAALERRGVTLFLDGERLHYRAPKGALDAELRGWIAKLRHKLIAHLRYPPPPQPSRRSLLETTPIDELVYLLPRELRRRFRPEVDALREETGMSRDEAERAVFDALRRISLGEDIEPERPRLLPGGPPFQVELHPDAVAKVRAVEAQALALGWTRELLYNTSDALIWPNPRYGLVTYLSADDQLGEVSAERIAIHGGDGHVTHLHNPRTWPVVRSDPPPDEDAP